MEEETIVKLVAKGYAALLRAMSLCGGAEGMGELLRAEEALRHALELLRED